MIQQPPNNDKKYPTQQVNDPFQPVTIEHPISNETKENNTIANFKEDKGQYKNKINWTSWITSICTIFIVIITGLYTYYAREQVAQMKEALNLNSDTVIRQLRAYIFIEKVSLENIVQGYTPNVIIQFVNSGQTPAYNVSGSTGFCFREFPLTSALPNIGQEGHKTIMSISAKGEFLRDIKMERPLTTNDITQLMNGTHAIYVYGSITYKDTFARERHTNYRFFYNHRLRATALPFSCMISDMEGNEAD
jgi:hypothetical protein